MLSSTEEIKAKLDIVDVIQEYFPLKQAGVNFKARCPFHEEKTPSFMVNRERQFFHCFGCQESGDVFSFLQKMENIEFPEALKILANKAGVKLPEYNPQMANLKTRVLEMQAVAMAWFHNQLLNSAAGQKALSYLKDKRKLSAATIEEWQLGYALDSWDALSQYLKGKNFTHQEILQSGLVVPKERSQDYYDRFRDRVMFPIEDYHGNIVGFTGRTLKEDEGAKYINTPQTAVYNKSEVIFGLYKAKAAIKDEDQVVIVEGNMDVIASSGAKIKNVVAVSGTALTVEQIRILKRLTNDFIFAFDADQAGIRAAERSIGLALSQEVKVKVIAINQSLGKDPDEIIKRDVALWKKLIAEAPWAMDYFFEMKFRGYQPEEIESKKQVARDLLNLIIKLASPLEHDYYLKKLAEKLEVREEALREAVKKARQQKKPGVASQVSAQTQQTDKNVKSIDRKAAVAERLLAGMMARMDYMEYVGENLVIEYLPMACQEFYKILAVYYTKEYKQGGKVENYIKENQPELTNQLNCLIILKEELKQLSDHEFLAEIKRLIFELKKDFIKNKLLGVAKEISDNEDKFKKSAAAGQEELKNKIDKLMQEFSELSGQLKEN